MVSAVQPGTAAAMAEAPASPIWLPEGRLGEQRRKRIKKRAKIRMLAILKMRRRRGLERDAHYSGEAWRVP